MSTSEVVRSTCGICLSGCGILVHLENGKPSKIEGDPDAPLNKGALCSKALASLEYLYHPNRLKHPLKRAGERGGGNWQQISWDEALGTIADEMIKAKENYGVESVAILRGSAKGLQDGFLSRLANAFGTPNITSMAFVCYWPRANAYRISFGSELYPDFEYPPACIVLWGYNPAEVYVPDYVAIARALSRGAKLIVIDPTKTGFAAKADLWVQSRPGSDLALALGMLNVIVNEGLFDRDFVDTWTFGFDELETHVQDYPPEKVEEITWVPAEMIKQIARFYAANGPACIVSANGLEENVNGLQAHRAIAILETITGNIGVPGGKVPRTTPPLLSRSSPEFTLQDKIPKERRARRLGAELKLMPIAMYAHPTNIMKAVIEGDPYPVRVVYVQGGNLLLSLPNAQETYKAFRKLDFLAVADMFMTPTAMLADIVLPVASFLEFDAIVQTGVFPPVAQVQQRVAQVGECLSDCEILNELAKKLGLGEYFWGSYQEFLADIMKPTGITFDEFRRVGAICGAKSYRSHEAKGFATPSGKVEIYSSQLKKWGFDPLPVYYELPETLYSDPELAKEYPLIFTNWKRAPFRHSGGRQISVLRGSHPEPTVNIHPETATKLGIRDGDWVYIETKRGRIKQKAALTDWINPLVVAVDFGWWFPEKAASELYGWSESNINILTDNTPYGRETGAPNLRGILCKVYKV